MKKITAILLGLGLVFAGDPAVGRTRTIGIDFDNTGSAGTAPAAALNFNHFDGNAFGGIAAGATATFNGTLIDTAGKDVPGVGFRLTNYTGQRTNRATSDGGSAGPGPFDDETLYGDRIISNETAGVPIGDNGNFRLTFTGLNDRQTYDISGGYLLGANNNFDSTWSIVTDSQPQTFISRPADGGYGTMTAVHSVGGELQIRVNERTLHVTVGALTLTWEETGSVFIIH